MELQFSSIPFLFTVFFFTIWLLLRKRSTFSKKNLPPGPWKLPFIGNIHQMVGSLPHHKLRDLSLKYGPLMHIQLGEVSSLVVSSSEMAQEVMKKHDTTFAYRPVVLAGEIISYNSTNIAFAPYGDYWRQLRKICTLELLSTRRVESFRFVREEEVSNLIDFISSNAGSPINLTEKVYSLAYGITSRTALGKKTKDQDRFIEIVEEATKLAAGFHVGDVFPSFKWLHVIGGMRPKLEKLHGEADRILSAIIEDHLQSREKGDVASEDLIDVLLKFVEQDDLGFSLTLDNVKAVILDIFAAGSETSATLVIWAMAEMMKNPRILNEAQNEVRNVFDKRGRVDEDGISQLHYLQLVIKETLRLHPPLVLLLPRESRERCEISGFQIPLNTKVIINAWAIGRDPKYWKQPEKFYPERFRDNSIEFKGNHFEYIPFGAGRRICPGIVFGLTNTQYQLAMLLYHFNWELPDGKMKNEELDMTEEFGVTVKRKHHLHLVPTIYHPQS